MRSANSKSIHRLPPDSNPDIALRLRPLVSAETAGTIENGVVLPKQKAQLTPLHRFTWGMLLPAVIFALNGSATRAAVTQIAKSVTVHELSRDAQFLAYTEPEQPQQVKLWSLTDNKVARILTVPGENVAVSSLVFAPDSLFVGTSQGELIQFPLAGPDVFHSIGKTPNATPIVTVLLSPTAGHLAAVQSDQVTVWDRRDRKQLAVIPVSDENPHVTFKPHLAVVTQQAIWEYDPASDASPRVSRLEPNTTLGKAARSYDGKLLAANSTAGLDLFQLGPTKHLRRHKYLQPLTPHFSPNDEWLVTINATQTSVDVWKVVMPAGALEHKKTISGVRASSIAFDPKSTRVCIPTQSQTGLEIVDLSSQQKFAPREEHPSSQDDSVVTAISFSHDSNLVYTAYDNGRIQRWSKDAVEELAKVSGKVTQLYNPFGTTLILSTSNGDIYVLPDAPVGGTSKHLRFEFPGEDLDDAKIARLELSPDGSKAAVSQVFGEDINVIDLSARRRIWSSTSRPIDFGFSMDSKRLLLVYANSTQVLEADTGKSARIVASSNSLQLSRFVGFKRKLYSGGYNILFDPQNGRRIRMRPSFIDRSADISASVDPSVLVYVGHTQSDVDRDKGFELLEIPSSRILGTGIIQLEEIGTSVVTPDARHIVIAGWKELNVIDVSTASVARTIRAITHNDSPSKLTNISIGNELPVDKSISLYSQLAAGPNGLLAVGSKRQIEIWNYETGEFLHRIVFDYGHITDLQFSSHAHKLAFGLGNSLHVFDVSFLVDKSNLAQK